MVRLFAEGGANSDFGAGRVGSDGRSGFVVKIGLDGKHRWTLRVPVARDNDEGGPSIAVARSGHAWVFGTFFQPKAFGNKPAPASSRDHDPFLIEVGP